VTGRVLNLELPGGRASAEDVRRILRAAAPVPDGAPWALKVKVSPPGKPAWIEPGWLEAALAGLGCGPGSYGFDTVSISTQGLETAEGLRVRARSNGLDGGPGVPDFVAVGEGEEGGPAGARALGILNPVRPDPHFGFRGVTAELGAGMLDREGKLALHRRVRPRVDTPLCAGCGSCMVACLYDAIELRGGRATVIHERCTGCGECISACHMEGLAFADADELAGFQRAVAASAAAVRGTVSGPQVYLNLLVDLDRYTTGPGRRLSLALQKGNLLAGTDPVAVDQAAWDLLKESCGGSIHNWHGYSADPAALLAEAEALGLGTRRYDLRSPGTG